jgi:hypothetical protein
MWYILNLISNQYISLQKEPKEEIFWIKFLLWNLHKRNTWSFCKIKIFKDDEKSFEKYLEKFLCVNHTLQPYVEDIPFCNNHTLKLSVATADVNKFVELLQKDWSECKLSTGEKEYEEYKIDKK